MSENHLICVGIITGAKGLKGQVRVKVFTENPLNIGTYPRLQDEQGHTFKIIACHLEKDTVIASFGGIMDRTQAESLKGTKLFIKRDQLPDLKEEETYYITDLIGLDVLLPTGEKIGVLKNVYNFGAGDILEFYYTPQGQDLMIPFHKEFVSDVNLKVRWLKISPTYLESLLAQENDK